MNTQVGYKALLDMGDTLKRADVYAFILNGDPSMNTVSPTANLLCWAKRPYDGCIVSLYFDRFYVDNSAKDEAQ